MSHIRIQRIMAWTMKNNHMILQIHVQAQTQNQIQLMKKNRQKK